MNSEFSKDAKSMEEIVAVVRGIVYFQKIKQDDGVILFRLVEPVLENELDSVRCRMVPVFAGMMLDHL